MIYVVSDIHNKYDSFMTLLDEVKFSPEDTLIINGDAIDRSGHAAKVIKFILDHKEQIHFVIGNHEHMFIDAYETGELFKPMVKHTKKKLFGRKSEVKRHENEKVDQWFYVGGMQTFDSMVRYRLNTGVDILNNFYNYLKEQKDHFVLGDNLFVHASPKLYKMTDNKEDLIKWVEEHPTKDLIWDREFYEKAILKGQIKSIPMNIFIGHTSVVKSRNHRIYGIRKAYRRNFKNGYSIINTDFSSDKDDESLALYCLDTGKLYRKLYDDITVF